MPENSTKNLERPELTLTPDQVVEQKFGKPIGDIRSIIESPEKIKVNEVIDIILAQVTFDDDKDRQRKILEDLMPHYPKYRECLAQMKKYVGFIYQSGLLYEKGEFYLGNNQSIFLTQEEIANLKDSWFLKFFYRSRGTGNSKQLYQSDLFMNIPHAGPHGSVLINLGGIYNQNDKDKVKQLIPKYNLNLPEIEKINDYAEFVVPNILGTSDHVETDTGSTGESKTAVHYFLNILIIINEQKKQQLIKATPENFIQVLKEIDITYIQHVFEEFVAKYKTTFMSTYINMEHKENSNIRKLFFQKEEIIKKLNSGKPADIDWIADYLAPQQPELQQEIKQKLSSLKSTKKTSAPEPVVAEAKSDTSKPTQPEPAVTTVKAADGVGRKPTEPSEPEPSAVAKGTPLPDDQPDVKKQPTDKIELSSTPEYSQFFGDLDIKPEGLQYGEQRFVVDLLITDAGEYEKTISTSQLDWALANLDQLISPQAGGYSFFEIALQQMKQNATQADTKTAPLIVDQPEETVKLVQTPEELSPEFEDFKNKLEKLLDLLNDANLKEEEFIIKFSKEVKLYVEKTVEAITANQVSSDKLPSLENNIKIYLANLLIQMLDEPMINGLLQSNQINQNFGEQNALERYFQENAKPNTTRGRVYELAKEFGLDYVWPYQDIKYLDEMFLSENTGNSLDTVFEPAIISGSLQDFINTPETQKRKNFIVRQGRVLKS